MSVGRKIWASADKLGPNNAVRLVKPAVKPRAYCRTPATIFDVDYEQGTSRHVEEGILEVQLSFQMLV